MNALFEQAEAIMQPFHTLMVRVATAAGVDADMEVEWEGSKLVLDKARGVYYKGLTLAPLKGRARCAEKVKNEYGGDVNRLVDVVRCSIVVTTEDQLVGVADVLQKEAVIVRLKNRFKDPLWYLLVRCVFVCLLVATFDLLLCSILPWVVVYNIT